MIKLKKKIKKMDIKQINNIFVDLKVRTSKLENEIYQIILEKIKTEDVNNLEKIFFNGIELEIEKLKLDETDLEEGLLGLMNKGVNINYYKENKRIKLFFNYINSFEIVENRIIVYVPLNIIGSVTTNG